MYRCFACDSPAQYNCGCHTQLEVPEGHQPQAHQVMGHSYPKKNISSGEDAILEQVETKPQERPVRVTR